MPNARDWDSETSATGLQYDLGPVSWSVRFPSLYEGNYDTLQSTLRLTHNSWVLLLYSIDVLIIYLLQWHVNVIQGKNKQGG